MALAPPCYQRHRPEDSVLSRTLETHLEAFLARASEQRGGEGLPSFATRELRAYLRCGRLEHGSWREVIVLYAQLIARAARVVVPDEKKEPTP